MKTKFENMSTKETNLLTAAQPESQEPCQTLLTAAMRIGEASGDIMAPVNDADSSQV